MDEQFTRISNDILEALARTNLSPYETRFLMVLFRKTYGYQKKEDWIALSQIVEMTGMHKAHVSRAKAKLMARNIVTQTGNRIAFNKYHTQWRELPRQVTVTSSGNSSVIEKIKNGSANPTSPKVAQTGTPASSGNAPPPIQVITPPPKQADTKETITKESLQKKELSSEELERSFHELLTENGWCDEHYAGKTWSQGQSLPAANRTEFLRKVKVMLNSGTHPRTLPLAKKLYHEIAGYVNDTGAMARGLSWQEVEARRLFKEETGQVIEDA